MGVPTKLGVSLLTTANGLPTTPDYHWLPTDTGFGEKPFQVVKPTPSNFYHNGSKWNHPIPQKKQFSINLNSRVHPDDILWFLYAFGFTGSVVGSAAPYVHTLNAVGASKPFLMIDAYSTTGLWYYYNCKISQLQFTFNNNDDVRLAVTAVGVKDKYTSITSPTITHPDYDKNLRVSKSNSMQAIHSFVYNPGTPVNLNVAAKSNTASLTISRTVNVGDPSMDDETDSPMPMEMNDYTFAWTSSFNHGYLDPNNPYLVALSLCMGGDGAAIPAAGGVGRVGTHTFKALGGIIATTERFYMQYTDALTQISHNGYTNDNTTSTLEFEPQGTPEIEFQASVPAPTNPT